MEKPSERTPPQQPQVITCTISGTLAEYIQLGAANSGLTLQQYVLSLLWHNVPLPQDKPQGLPHCVQLVLNDIHNHYV